MEPSNAFGEQPFGVGYGCILAIWRNGTNHVWVGCFDLKSNQKICKQSVLLGQKWVLKLTNSKVLCTLLEKWVDNLLFNLFLDSKWSWSHFLGGHLLLLDRLEIDRGLVYERYSWADVFVYLLNNHVFFSFSQGSTNGSCCSRSKPEKEREGKNHVCSVEISTLPCGFVVLLGFIWLERVISANSHC